jgi:hypothetical protein
MKLRTEVPIEKAEKPITYDSRIFSVGSCFAENIARKLGYFQFPNDANPTGILFHPAAISKLFSDAFSKRVFSQADIFRLNGRWHCPDAHSALSDADDSRVVASLNEAMKKTRLAAASATHIIITLGTAGAYRHKETGNLVANCHKVPQREFSKELLSVEAVCESLSAITDRIGLQNPSAQILFTVSPVRHLKDGFAENQRSKAHLIAAVHQIVQAFPNCHYFPAYEIMMDELRDYRFYADDMLHPSAVAIDYIWERFASAWISQESAPVMEKVAAVRRRLAHRPFDASGIEFETFRKNLEADIESLTRRFPSMDFGI